MRLAWFRKDKKTELESYDNIGLAYYYLGDINKAIYYHNRMMNKRFEGETQEKHWNNLAITNKYSKDSYKRALIQKSIFEKYKDDLKNNKNVFPHENIEYTTM